MASLYPIKVHAHITVNPNDGSVSHAVINYTLVMSVMIQMKIILMNWPRDMSVDCAQESKLLLMVNRVTVVMNLKSQHTKVHSGKAAKELETRKL